LTNKSGLLVLGGLAALLAAPRLLVAAKTPPAEERETEIIATPLKLGVHGAAKHSNVTRELFIEGQHTTGTPNSVNFYAVILLADASTGSVYITFKVPDDFVSLISVKAVLMINTTGDIVWGMGSNQVAEGEPWTTHSDTDYTNIATVPATARDIFSVQGDATILADAQKGDFVGIRFFREGGHASDTAAADLEFLGILLTYTAEQ